MYKTVIWNVSQTGVLYNMYILSNSFHITVLTLWSVR